MTEDEGCIFVEYTVLAVVHMMCRADDVTIKTTFNNVLYLFIASSTLFALALADLKETLMSHVINEFKFQRAIHENGKSLYLYNNVTRVIEV